MKKLFLMLVCALALSIQVVKAQEEVAAAYQDKMAWAKKALLNIARSGKFSSDRTIEDYVKDIWKLEKLTIK